MNQMKKLSILLAIVSLMIVVTACNRRDKYRNPELTGSEEVSSGTVTGADSDTNLPQGEGNPYQNMTAEELLTLYQETPEHSRISTPHAFDTPYYYIFASDTAYTGGQAYSKLTGQIVTLCKDMTCSHKGEDSCLFKDEIAECFVMGNRVYILVSSISAGYKLYSLNLMLDDVELIYEWENTDSPSRFSTYNGKIYMMGSMVSEDQNVTRALFVLNPQTKTCAFAMEEHFTFQSGSFINGILYYTNQDGSLWQCDIATNAHACLLPASLLNLEQGDVRFIVSGSYSSLHLNVRKQSLVKNRMLYYDVNTGNIVQDQEVITEKKGRLLGWTDKGQYCLLNHDTIEYEDDPHYTYYTDRLNGLVNNSGGKIWFRQSGEDEWTLLASLKTDDIPDAIRYVAAMDAKSMLVAYSTYKDFDNVYNGYQKNTEEDLCIRYAVIDLETGAVYKNDLVY